MLYGFMTGLNAFAFMGKVEDATAGRIDWNTVTGGLEDPWPPDVWIEGNNGRDAMRVTYKGRLTEFAYTEYTTDNHELRSDDLAAAVIAHLERCIGEDPNPDTEANRTRPT
ncbi:hypothetical protein GCM10027447_34720 [Glycomyces halotolerans]